MTKLEFERVLKAVQVGEALGIEIQANAPLKHLTMRFGYITQYGTGILCHVELVIDKIIENGVVVDLVLISANGKEVAIERASKYLEDLPFMKIYIIGYENDTEEDRQAYVAMAKTRLGVKYDWHLIGIQTRKGLVCKIPLLGWLLKQFVYTTAPIFNKNPSKGTICSKELALYYRSRHPDYLKKYWIDYIYPALHFEADETTIYRP